jgi:hypothetical protein
MAGDTLGKDGKNLIKIFPKSGKNSTEARVSIHDTLYEAFELHGPLRVNSRKDASWKVNS